MRPVLRSLLNLTIGAGILLAVLPLGQFCYGHWSQHQLENQWEAQRARAVSPANVRKAIKRQTMAGGTALRIAAVTAPPTGKHPPAAASSKHGAARKGGGGQKPAWPITKLRIPSIELSAFVVQGQEPADLRRGPGHDENSSIPGQGNCVISGHRNIYGSYFLRLDELQPGDPVILETARSKYTYTVRRSFSTPDSNLTVLALPQAGQPAELTLVTCTLPHTNERIVLQCDLETASE